MYSQALVMRKFKIMSVFQQQKITFFLLIFMTLFPNAIGTCLSLCAIK